MGTKTSGSAGSATATAVRPQEAREHPTNANHTRAPRAPVATAASAPASTQGALIHQPLRRGPPIWFRTWIFRVWLVAATVVLCATLLWLQSLLGAVPLHPTPWQTAVQWSELIWLCPVPSAAAIWLGWVLFAAAARPDPTPIPAPQLRRTRSAAPLYARLVLRIPTRGENVAVLRDAVAAAHEAFAAYPDATGSYRTEIVSERPLDLGEVAGRTRVYVVPLSYATPVGE